tara:strand:- start:15 stop:194 length:180 start_codon:yes stop_codon:yes gene_type:complete
MKEQKINFPINPYYGQVWHDGESKKTYEYIEVGEGSTDINNDPINGFWTEIDWNHKRLP